MIAYLQAEEGDEYAVSTFLFCVFTVQDPAEGMLPSEMSGSSNLGQYNQGIPHRPAWRPVSQVSSHSLQLMSPVITLGISTF